MLKKVKAEDKNFLLNKNKMVMEGKLVGRILSNISGNIQNYIDDIRILVEQAYLEGVSYIELEKIRQKFIYLPIRDTEEIILITKSFMSILPKQKINFKGKFQQIIYKLAVIKEIFDSIQQYLQNKISFSNTVKFIVNANSKVITNMNIKDSTSEEINEELNLYEVVANR